MRLLHSCFLLLLLIVPARIAGAKDICEEISSNPVVENHFAEHQQQTLTKLRSKQFAGLRLSVEPSTSPGTCRGKDVLISRQGEEAKLVQFLCDYNGCTFGAELGLVQWKDKVYIVAKGWALAQFQNLFGWNQIARRHQARIVFRSLVREIYELQPDGRALAVCGEYGWRWKQPLIEKLIAGSKQCKSYAAAGNASIFPPKSDPPQSIRLEHHPFGQGPSVYYTVDLSTTALADLDGDGTIERIVPGAGSSAAGCGCDYGGLTFLDANNQPIDPENRLSQGLKDVTSQMMCGESLDVIKSKQTYLLVRKNRWGARQVYGLTGTTAFQPLCTFINDAPLSWKVP